ncbi:ATP-binding protein [Alcaligenes faecalis]|uniref:AAA family ATPase n=1 Tax=Alcaligenes faecalis TaxID=511 RepID=UPI00137BDDA1|nr:AAA family ATPase [Alcaligenes faecalis]QHS36941.1 ATP-binding protein [Alcaligenes faecalis]
MTKQALDVSLPKGIHRVWDLPDTSLGTLWNSIVMEQEAKDQLLAQAIVNFSVRGKVDRSIIPMHGVILLVGPPGTGKTSLAKGLANSVAIAFKGTNVQLLEVEPHSLTSSAMGKTQRAVSDLFSQSIGEVAASGQPTIVLLDEVETLAADRAKMSMEANPVDVHRATDAVLVQLDLLAEKHPNLLFVATSNFPQAVDSAFLSRCDLVMEVPLPGKDACRKILEECLVGVAKTFSNVGALVKQKRFDECASECEGLDGRAIRKVVANALATNKTTAIDPNQVTIEHLLAAIKKAKQVRLLKEKAK